MLVRESKTTAKAARFGETEPAATKTKAQYEYKDKRAGGTPALPKAPVPQWRDRRYEFKGDIKGNGYGAQARLPMLPVSAGGWLDVRGWRGGILIRGGRRSILCGASEGVKT